MTTQIREEMRIFWLLFERAALSKARAGDVVGGKFGGDVYFNFGYLGVQSSNRTSFSFINLMIDLGGGKSVNSRST